MNDLLPENIRAIQPYVPGKPIEEVERELGLSNVCKMASNENPLGPSPLAMEALRDVIDRVHRYPDGDGFYLRQRLAAEQGLPMDQLILGNGSVDIIEIAARTFLGRSDNAVISDGAFLMYNLAVQAVNGNSLVVPMKDYGHDLRAMARAINDKTKLVYIANPNNPTGTYVTAEEMDRFFAEVPDNVIVVLDEAYYEYICKEVSDFPDSFRYLRAGKNVVILRTFSKIYGLAGIRMGYGMAHEELISALNKVRSPFNTNSLSQVAAQRALDDQEHVERSRRLNREGLDYLQGEMDRLGIHYVPSHANFILVDTGRDCGEAFNGLLREGVIVRPMKGYRLPTCLRVSVSVREDNERFLRGLARVLGKGSGAEAVPPPSAKARKGAKKR